MTQQILQQIRIVLVETSHPGNIGAAARAMKTMGLRHLVLVQPKQFPDAEATARASGADDILAAATVVDSLEDAVADCELVVGTSARMRTLSWPLSTLHDWTHSLAKEPIAGKIAILFGSERVGLSNQQLQTCHCHITIPSNPDYSSLNLGSAVQIVCYELRQALLDVALPEVVAESPVATAGELEGFFQHLERVLYLTDFLDPKQPKQLLARLRRLYLRADLDQQELNILRGILSAVEKSSL